MRMVVESAENGWIVKWQEDTEQEEGIEHSVSLQRIFEFCDEDKARKNTFMEMLWFLASMLEVNNDSSNEWLLNIEIKKNEANKE